MLACCAAAAAAAPGIHAARGGRPARIHPALRNPVFGELPPGRSPFQLQRSHGRVPARVRTRDVDALYRDAESLGVVVRAVVGEIASVEVPETALDALAGLPGVVSIHPGRAYRPVNDVSTAEIGARAAAATYGGTGRGAIVAVIDTGLDFRHRDLRKPDGTSRVLAAWDQTDAAGGGAGCPAGTAFGRCYTKADLDADLSGGPAANLFDGHGHGTHVAGTAAGNGLATANGVPAGTYAGVATEADLLIVKVFTSSGFFAGDLTAAYAWIADRAAAAGEPFVINMSLGSDFGAHDGTDPDELSLDALLAPGARGRAAAIAAGNEQGAGIHSEGTAVVSQGNLHSFLVPSYTPASGAGNDAVLFDLWYEGPDSMTVGLVDPNDVTLATAAKGSSSGLVCTPSGGVTIDATNASDPDNGDCEVLITLSDTASCPTPTPPPAGKTMKVRVTGVAVPAGGRYHLWTDGGLGPGGARVRFTPAVESTLVGMPGTSRQATTAGSYITRNCWPNADPNSGQTCFSTPPIGSLSSFSSTGPTRDGRLKPEVSAPGDRVVSSLSANRSAPGATALSPDAMHWALRGTSMASPHVAGALAIVLQMNPALDAAQARQMLIDGARADTFTGVVPNTGYGYGKLGALGSAQAVLKPIEDLSAGGGGDFTWTAEPHSATYNVYRGGLPGTLPASYGVCFASGLPAPGFNDAQTPVPGAAFFYLVTGVKDGVEGSLGFDSAGRRRVGSAGCP